MVLNKLKQIRDELKESAKTYDEAFKNTALIAAESLVAQEQLLNNELQENSHKLTSGKIEHKTLPITLNKQYFIEKYGSLKKTKEAYTKAYGKKKYGKSWQDFLAIATDLPLIEKPVLTLEVRVTRIETILNSMGYKL